MLLNSNCRPNQNSSNIRWQRSLPDSTAETEDAAGVGSAAAEAGAGTKHAQSAGDWTICEGVSLMPRHCCVEESGIVVER